MPINQLFRIIPNESTVQLILDAFGLSDLEDTRYFTKENMNESNTIQLLTDLIPQLSHFYLPCKLKNYLSPQLTHKKCITILRQFIKLYHYKCIGIEKSIQGTKQITYRLLYDDVAQLSPSITGNREYILDFAV